MIDVEFCHPSTWLVCGPSSSGKTTFVTKLIQNYCPMFGDDKRRNLLFFYKQWQPSYEKILANTFFKVTFINAPPTEDGIVEYARPFQKTGCFVIIDDFMQNLDKSMSSIFTTHAHHLNILVCLLSQNLFPKNPFFRDISLNSTYVVIFKNPRDLSQLTHFARQFAPGRTRSMATIFKEALKLPYSYLVVDLHQSTPEKLRLKSNIFPRELPMIVWEETLSK